MIELTQRGIETIFNLKIKESLHVEYISATDLATLDEKKTVFFSSLISSMANADGGYIFIGIESKRKIPQTIQTVTNMHAVSWLTNLCNTAIFPAIPQCRIEKIMVSEQHFIIGMHIPNSHKAPHMSIDYKYYKRVETKAVVMEEYEIRDLYTKGKRPELELYSIVNTNGIPLMQSGKFQIINFYPRFLIKNTSSSIEHFYKVEISVPSQINNPNFDSLQKYFSRFEDGHSIFSISHKTPLFQNEIATVAEANFVVDAHTFHVFEEGEICIKLFFSSGIDTRIFKCKELLVYKNNQIERSDFTETQLHIEPGTTQEQIRLF